MFTNLLNSSLTVQKPALGIRSKASMTYLENLEVGQYWEKVLETYLTDSGLEVDRPRQFYSNPRDYSRFQRDLDIWTPAENLIHLEVKSRNDPWNWGSVDVGKTSTWDAKEFPVAALVVIDQETALAAVCPADKSQWLRRSNHDLCYSVPRHLFSPIETFIDSVKAGLYD